MDFVRIAIEEARRLIADGDNHVMDVDRIEYLKKRRERIYRRLTEAIRDFNGLLLKSKRKLLVENSGSAIMFPCIRLYEAMEYENTPLVDIFIEITDDGEQSHVQCRAECLWFDPATRLTSCDPDKLMTNLAKQIATVLKVDAENAQ